MEPEAPPPTEHVLRPHHVALLSIFILTFKTFHSTALPAPFVLHVYRLLLSEVSEVARPRSYSELLNELSSAPKVDAEESRRFLSSFASYHNELATAEQLTNFFAELPSLFVEKNEDMRRSLFGYFCRRCFVSFIKLSFSGVIKLQRDYHSWRAGNAEAGYEPVQKDQLNHTDFLIFKTQADRKMWAKPEAFEAWEKGEATGDENLASENLRRFFEQHFHDSNDSGVRQHALLNLVRVHYTRGEYDAAWKVRLLAEAIIVARTSGDKITLQHCISMLHRLPSSSGQKCIVNEIQPDLHPMEVLYDVKKLTDPHNGQPLSASFDKIVQAVGLYDHWLDVQLAMHIDSEQWAQHTVQSIVWNAAGCHQLAAIEEDVVIAFTTVAGEDNQRLTVILNKAHKLARQGQYNNSLKMLLDPEVWRGISITDYTSWAHEIWHILTLRTTRRGQYRLYQGYLLPKRPPGFFNAREYFFDTDSSPMSKIRDALYEVLQMRQYDQASATIEHLLRALWHSEFLCHYDSYRIGIILLADIGLEFGMTKRCRRILDEVMSQIINGDDLEQRAVACFTLARCIVASGGPADSALQEAIRYLLIAEGDFKTLQIYRSLLDVQYLLSVMYHNLGATVKRDECAERHIKTENELRRLETIAADEEVEQIFDTVAIVGATLARR
ncbi:hypothetical protein M378DRAFT_68525 [Amanita muscaria Koide BX008]|uniref:Anaphase-promoting complex subunit 5 n=1 Tax=Amanita muscaria (strain Koide BX008) TaxID=946122 RepID=A0A0C2X5W5_AMAMK|nr:hypothetical protein M378DRAFT_68525 [Amanita muscaria Koide BX008]